MRIRLARLTRVASIHFLSLLFASTIYAVRSFVSVRARSRVQPKAKMGHTIFPLLAFYLLGCVLMSPPFFSFFFERGQQLHSLWCPCDDNAFLCAVISPRVRWWTHSAGRLASSVLSCLPMTALAPARQPFPHRFLPMRCYCAAHLHVVHIFSVPPVNACTITHIDALPWLWARVKDNRGGWYCLRQNFFSCSRFLLQKLRSLSLHLSSSLQASRCAPG